MRTTVLISLLFVDSFQISEFKLYEKLLENLQFEAKEVYSAAAEVCGLVLAQLSSVGNLRDSHFEQALKAKVPNLFCAGLCARMCVYLRIEQLARERECGGGQFISPYSFESCKCAYVYTRLQLK